MLIKDIRSRSSSLMSQQRAGASGGGSGRPPPDPTGRQEIRATNLKKRKDLVKFLKEHGYKSRGFTGSHEDFYNASGTIQCLFQRDVTGR